MDVMVFDSDTVDDGHFFKRNSDFYITTPACGHPFLKRRGIGVGICCARKGIVVDLSCYIIDYHFFGLIALMNLFFCEHFDIFLKYKYL